MKKTIIIITLAVIFLLALTPSVSAIQHATSKEIIQNHHSNKLLTIRTKINTLTQILAIDFSEIFVIMCNLMITYFLGKPSLVRMFSNVVGISVIIYGLKTGELVPKCDKYIKAMFLLPLQVFAAYIYSKTNLKIIGSFVLFLASMISMYMMYM